MGRIFTAELEARFGRRLYDATVSETGACDAEGARNGLIRCGEAAQARVVSHGTRSLSRFGTTEPLFTGLPDLVERELESGNEEAGYILCGDSESFV